MPNLTLTISCTPDRVGPGDYVDCTVTYSNTGTGPADYIEFHIDYPESQGTVSLITPPSGDTYTDDGSIITWIPTGSLSIGNIPPGDSGTLTYRFTVNDNEPDGSFTNTVTAYFDNGTDPEVAQPLTASDTTTVTAAVVSSFSLKRAGGQVWVLWETALEVMTAGFYVERLDPESGRYLRLNQALLPAMGHGATGARYAFLDTGARPQGTYTYRLVEVESRGRRLIHGPYTRTVSPQADIPPDRALGFAAQEKHPDARQLEAWLRKQKMRRDERALHRPQGGEAKIHTREDGLYDIPVSALASALGVQEKLLRQQLSKGRLALRHRNASVPYLPSDDGLYFIAKAVDSLYTDTNTYWARLVQGNAQGRLMEEVDGTPDADPSAGQWFLSCSTLEEDKVLVPYAVSDPDGDPWFAGFVTAGRYGQQSYETKLDAPGVVQGQATLRLWFKGATDLMPGNDHHALVWINGHQVGETMWDGMAEKALEVRVDAAMLNETGNAVVVEDLIDDPGNFSSFLVERLELCYPRRYQAVEDRLYFTAHGYPVITVEGFSGPDIAVFDLSGPKRVKGVKVEKGAGGYQVSFRPPAPQGQYLAVRLASAHAPVEVVADNPSSLKEESHGAEYLIIAPSSLMDGAEALAAYRRRSFQTMVVDLQDIYDEFNGGIEDAHAIRDFLAYARTHWALPPTFVVLVGKGTLDPKDIYGYGTNVLPVLTASTPYGLFASDTRLADVEGDDGVPEFAIGRIPALASEDVIAYVDKLARHESASSLSRAVMLADNADKAGDFPADSQAVAGLLPLDVDKAMIAHEAGGDPEVTRSNIIAQLNAGSDLFNYIGHGGPTLLGSEGFMVVEDIASLDNGEHLPLFAAFTCYVGYGAYPGLDSLAERMTMAAGRGSIAAFAPTGLSENGQAVRLNKAFVQALYNGHQTVGEAAQAAKAQVKDEGGARFIRDIYDLTGDPALSLY
ncbi:MAG: hypothetical protein D6819_09335 [Gammaproteobacteria bacterium]|nr:MAG: hypothetical protein D6819_09335 [Gammaproteobacteria bacterium]